MLKTLHFHLLWLRHLHLNIIFIDLRMLLKYLMASLFKFTGSLKSKSKIPNEWLHLHLSLLQFGELLLQGLLVVILVQVTLFEGYCVRVSCRLSHAELRLRKHRYRFVQSLVWVLSVSFDH
jgi:hypothetical protein